MLLTRLSSPSCLQNASMMQLLPYGWNLTKSGGKHKVIRGGLYNQMGRIQGVQNHYWINSNPKHAFFQKWVTSLLCQS